MRESGTCKHFNGCGLTRDDKRCDVGVCYRTHVGGPDFGWATRIPCIRIQYNGKPVDQSKVVACNKYEEPTPEEIAADKLEIEAVIARMRKTTAVIGEVKREHKGQDWKGTKTCPVCSGILHMSHAAYNGHVWGKCETEGCVAWME